MQVTDFLSAIPIGVLIGVLGRLILPGKQDIGIFITFLIGVGAALLGTLVAGLFNIDDNAPAEWIGLKWDWIVLSIQVAFAVVGIGLANVLTYTKLASNDRPARKPRKRRKARAKADD